MHVRESCHASCTVRLKFLTLEVGSDVTILGRYGRDTGFTTHRNGELVARFMVDVVGFESADEAMTLRNEYFERFHSTFKSLSQMELDGKLPKNAPPNPQKLLGDYWAANAEFRKFLQPDSDFVAALKSLPQKKVLFSNGYELANSSVHSDSHITGALTHG